METNKTEETKEMNQVLPIHSAINHVLDAGEIASVKIGNNAKTIAAVIRDRFTGIETTRIVRKERGIWKERLVPHGVNKDTMIAVADKADIICLLSYDDTSVPGIQFTMYEGRGNGYLDITRAAHPLLASGEGRLKDLQINDAGNLIVGFTTITTETGIKSIICVYDSRNGAEYHTTESIEIVKIAISPSGRDIVAVVKTPMMSKHGNDDCFLVTWHFDKGLKITGDILLENSEDVIGDIYISDDAQAITLLINRLFFHPYLQQPVIRSVFIDHYTKQQGSEDENEKPVWVMCRRSTIANRTSSAFVSGQFKLCDINSSAIRVVNARENGVCQTVVFTYRIPGGKKPKTKSRFSNQATGGSELIAVDKSCKMALLQVKQHNSLNRTQCVYQLIPLTLACKK